MEKTLIETLNDPKPNVNIYQDKYNGWKWEIKVAFDVIAESSKSYLKREDCINNLLLVGDKIKELRQNGDVF